MDNAPPCLFGIIAFGNDSSLASPGRLPDNTTALAVHDDTVRVWANTDLLPVTVSESGNRTRVLVGISFGVEGQTSAALADTNPRDLDGGFVLIDIDATPGKTTTTLSTDKFGTRRLYYSVSEGRLTFATHLSGLRMLGRPLEHAISDTTLLHYYNFGFTPSDTSLFPLVNKLPAGSSLTVSKGKHSVARYLDLKDLSGHPQPDTVDEEALCGRIDAALATGISRRARKGESVGISLSGGVDSGYIAQKLTQTGARVHGYNIAYQDYYDEEDRVDFLSRSLGIDVTKIRLSAEEIIENFERVSAASSEPASLNGSIMRFAAERAKADGLTKLFDGDGADRLFLGMNRYLGYKRAIDIYNRAEKFGMAGLLRMILGMLPGDEIQKFHILVSNWRAGIPPYPERKLGGVTRYDPDYEARVFQIGAQPYYERFKRDFGEFEFGSYFTYQSFHMCPEMFFHGSTEMMTDLGITPIPAFFTDEMVKIAFNTPTDWKLRDKTTKYILRKAAAQHMDKEYWMLPKIGLQSALAYVLQTEQGKRWYETLREKVLESAEYKKLCELAEGQEIETDRLVSLIAWKDAQAAARR